MWVIRMKLLSSSFSTKVVLEKWLLNCWETSGREEDVWAAAMEFFHRSCFVAHFFLTIFFGFLSGHNDTQRLCSVLSTGYSFYHSTEFSFFSTLQQHLQGPVD